MDAFLNYLTGLGWPAFAKAPSDAKALAGRSAGKDGNFEKFWPADIQLIGKDILRVHATIWPVILMHLGIPLPKTLFVHGHIRSSGRKMSKTLGNAISVEEMLKNFGVDGTRYLLMSAGTFGEDVDVTMERLIEKYNADLANGIGNLVSRVVKLSGNLQFVTSNSDLIQNSKILPRRQAGKIQNFIENLELNQCFELYMGYCERK